MNIKNVKLTPIQEDYKELIARKDVIIDSAMYRLNQIDKEISTLETEKIKLQEMVVELPKLTN